MHIFTIILNGLVFLRHKSPMKCLGLVKIAVSFLDEKRLKGYCENEGLRLAWGLHGGVLKVNFLNDFEG